MLEAIHNGPVDAALTASPGGSRMFLLDGPDRVYQTILEHMSEGVLSFTADGVILSANPRFAQFVQRPLEELSGAVLWDFVLPEDAERCRPLLPTEAAGQRYELTLSGVDGALVPVLLSLSVLDLGERRCFVGVATDLSEFKEREEALHRAHDTLERQVHQRTEALRSANEEMLAEIRERRNAEAALIEVENRLIQYSGHLETLVEQRTRQIRALERQRATMEQLAVLGRMAARVAHEINNPLAGIKNALLLLKDAVPAEHRYAHYVPRVQKEIDRIAAVVRRMFELSKPPGKDNQDSSAEGVLREIASLHAHGCRKRALKLDLRIDPACAETVVPAATVRQILSVLIQNAVDASPPGGRITVTASAVPGALVKYTVTDEGPGIPDERLAYVFEPFYTTKTAHREMGLGLGLCICRTLVSEASGTLSYRRSEKGGSVFTVELPLASQAFTE
ncbi:MAG: ATP-binding protein [FCB group bacterium]|nr:ATP-binding protein [FCB group bacterium]